MKELQRLLYTKEQEFKTALEATKNTTLLNLFENVLHVRCTIEMLKGTPPESVVVTNPPFSKPKSKPSSNGQFVLTEAVRAAAGSFESKEFTTAMVSNYLINNYPDKRIPKASVSATISNLTSQGAFERTYKGVGGSDPSRYRLPESQNLGLSFPSE